MSWTQEDLIRYVTVLQDLQIIEKRLVDGGLLFAEEMITQNTEFEKFAKGRIARLKTLYEPLNYESEPDVYYNDGTKASGRDEFGPAPAGWYWHVGRGAQGGPYKTQKEAILARRRMGAME
jgi:hypothetical protein